MDYDNPHNEPTSITCPRCNNRSFNPNDIRWRYCGFCHKFHDDLPPPGAPDFGPSLIEIALDAWRAMRQATRWQCVKRSPEQAEEERRRIARARWN